MIEKQELYCHECDNYVQFEMDMDLSGNHVLKCPVCGHEHCRVVKNGIITSDRWDSRNRNTYYISATSTTVSSQSTWNTSTATDSTFLYVSWMNTTTA